MPFFFSRKRGSVAQDMSLASAEPAGSPPPDPFEVELLSHLDVLYSVASRMAKGAVEAEDMVQDAIVKAMRSRDQYTPGTNFRAWVLSILTHLFIDRHHHGRLERELVHAFDTERLNDGFIGATTLSALRDPETLALRPLIEAEVRRALDALPEEQRIVVLLADVEELSYKEIAAALGCTVGSVTSRLHRARATLQQALRDHAAAMGLTQDESAEKRGGSETPADLSAYRRRKQGVA